MNKTLIAPLALLAALASSGCATTTAAPQFAAAETTTLSDAGRARARVWPQLQCPAPVGDNSLRAARCARAELLSTVGPAVPNLGF